MTAAQSTILAEAEEEVEEVDEVWGAKLLALLDREHHLVESDEGVSSFCMKVKQACCRH